MVGVFLMGFVIGFVGSMPIAGPIAVMVLGAAVEGRRHDAHFIGFGCAVAEAGYAILAFWGFSTLLGDYPWIEPVSKAVAAVLLIWLGVSFARRKFTPTDPTKLVVPKRGGSFALGFSVTALNPTLIATWAAAMAIVLSTGHVRTTPSSPFIFGLGACIGIAAWFTLLVELVTHFKRRFRPETMHKVVRVMGVGIVVLGVWFAWSFADHILG